jgi:hypothetical protein
MMIERFGLLMAKAKLVRPLKRPGFRSAKVPAVKRLA